MRTSNYYPVNQSQVPQMMASKTFASNVYSPLQVETHTMLPVIQMNDSRLQRSSIPVQQVMTNSQIHGQVIHMNDSLSHSSHYRPMMSPTDIQSGVYTQKQSNFIPASKYFLNRDSSSVISGSFIPVHQSQIPKIGSNFNIAQSNYVPNYQFRQ